MRSLLPKTLAAAVLAAVFALVPAFTEARELWTELPPSARNEVIEMPSFSPIAKKTMPGVVTVYTERFVNPFPFFPTPRVEKGAGSGFIVTEEGYILTNHHVVANSEKITVVVGVKNKKEYTATLIGSDEESDVALIKIEAEDLPVLPLGRSGELEVGDWVIAIGSPFNLPHTLTVGVVSAKGRRRDNSDYDDFIQTDASINSGNSGGPLINLRGEVVGINTMILSPSGGSVGIGLSIPIDVVKLILPQIYESGKVTRSWLGVTVEPVTGELADSMGLRKSRGAHVLQVVIGSPADKAGIEVDDVIVSFNGKDIVESKELPILVSSFGVGKKAELEIFRGGNYLSKRVLLEERPGNEALSRLRVRGGPPGPMTASADNALGIAVRDVTSDDRQSLGMPDLSGVVVEAVKSGSPAQQVGVEAGDVIYKLQGDDIGGVGDFEKAVAELEPGGYVRISVRRGNANLFRVFRLPG